MIEFILLIWNIVLTGILISVVYCQDNQLNLINLLNSDIISIRNECEKYFPRHINARCHCDVIEDDKIQD